MNNTLKNYYQLLKSPQTILLTMTGIAGYMSARCPVNHWQTLCALLISLIFSISGSTVLNMWYDRDIDKLMDRTHHRPLASGTLPQKNALIFGISLSMIGVLIGCWLSLLYGILLFLGIFFDFLIYTYWLKRRTCWSVIWGGIAGGMPILAGRVLGLGKLDGIGILLMCSVLFWIPTHMLTFSIRYKHDYHSAHIPTFPSTYGENLTRKLIAFSSIIASVFISSAAILVGIREGLLHLLGVLSGILMILSFLVMLRPSNQLNFSLFKYASIYMLSAMVLLVV